MIPVLENKKGVDTPTVTEERTVQLRTVSTESTVDAKSNEKCDVDKNLESKTNIELNGGSVPPTTVSENTDLATTDSANDKMEEKKNHPTTQFTENNVYVINVINDNNEQKITEDMIKNATVIMPYKCQIIDIDAPWTDTEELRKYMIENCITSKSWKRRQKCVNLLCNDDALVQKGSLGKILIDICSAIYMQVRNEKHFI